MADAPASQLPPDPFASAKANLRDTIKWLATAFAGAAAAILAGASLTGVSSASGLHLAIALAGGTVGLVSAFLATGTALRLLTAESFFLGQLAQDAELKARLDRYAPDILPPEFESIDALLKLRDAAIDDIRTFKTAPASEDYRGASAFFASLEPTVSRLVNLGHFEIMRRNFKRAEPRLFLLAICALVGLGTFAVFSGPAAKPAGEGDGPVVQLATGHGWSDVAGAYADSCGKDGPVKTELVREPQPGWIELRLLAPPSCAGLVVTVPAAIVVKPQSLPAR